MRVNTNMKIMYKLNLMSLAVILVMTFLFLLAEDVIIKGILFRSADKDMKLELSAAGENLINSIGLPGGDAVRDEAVRIQRRLSGKDDTREPIFWVIEKSGNKFVFHFNSRFSEKMPPEVIDEMMKGGGSPEIRCGVCGLLCGVYNNPSLKLACCHLNEKKRSFHSQRISCLPLGGFSFSYFLLTPLQSGFLQNMSF